MKEKIAKGVAWLVEAKLVVNLIALRYSQIWCMGGKSAWPDQAANF